jgi:hypothetical protein
MKSTIFIFLCASFLLSCKSGQKITKRQAAGLDTITDINLLQSKKKAIYKNENNEFYLMRYETDPRDSAARSDTMHLNREGGIRSTGFTVVVPNGRCDSENFEGTDRAAAKITISPASLQTYATLRSFINSLPDADATAAAVPNSSSPRIPAEDRNVRIKKTYLYAYSRQTDEDFHVIVGTTKKPSAITKYFNVEISGLPPAGDASFSQLQAVRVSFLTKASQRLCSSGYFFYENPLKIEVRGSLFYDKQHHNGLIGPAKARPPDAWEIHPVTMLIFK